MFLYISVRKIFFRDVVRWGDVLSGGEDLGQVE